MIEGNCALEHPGHCCDLYGAPASARSSHGGITIVKRQRSIKHVGHVGDVCGIPGANILIKCSCMIEHICHRCDVLRNPRRDSRTVKGCCTKERVAQISYIGARKRIRNSNQVCCSIKCTREICNRRTPGGDLAQIRSTRNPCGISITKVRDASSRWRSHGDFVRSCCRIQVLQVLCSICCVNNCCREIRTSRIPVDRHSSEGVTRCSTHR